MNKINKNFETKSANNSLTLRIKTTELATYLLTDSQLVEVKFITRSN